MKTTQRRVATVNENERVCAECGKRFLLTHGCHVVPALWSGEDSDDVTAPTVYFHSTPCFEKWTAAHRPRKIVRTPDPAPKKSSKKPGPGQSSLL